VAHQDDAHVGPETVAVDEVGHFSADSLPQAPPPRDSRRAHRVRSPRDGVFQQIP
jgi:hypothetical protein